MVNQPGSARPSDAAAKAVKEVLARVRRLAQRLNDLSGGANFLSQRVSIDRIMNRLKAAARLLWKIEKAYSLGIPRNKLAHGMKGNLLLSH